MKRAVVRVFGGLGNQMFIYAFARSLSEKLDIPVTLETRTGFVRDRYKRSYRLGAFDIKLSTCSPGDSLYFPLSGRSRVMTSLLFPKSETLLESESGFDSFTIPEADPNNILFFSGYWQDERYFNECATLIKEDLSLIRAVNQENRRMAEEMMNCDSIALHVRRKEYVDKLDFGYFLDAIDSVKARVQNPVIYLFSDEIAWCRDHIKADVPVIYVEHNSKDELSEFWLMSQAKHFIISNSSFSWWSAWMGRDPQKIVISPPNYMNN